MLLTAAATLHGWLYGTFDPPNAIKALLYVATWLAMLAGVIFLFVIAPRRNRANRWSTEDVFVLAILAVLLLAWDTFLNDQLFGPLVSSIPVAGNFLNWIQLPDLPYMFIVMVAVATIRKPGTVTSLIFVKRVLGEIMFSTHGLNIPNWPDALDEGILTDLFIMSRGAGLFSSPRAMLIDGFMIGVLRGGPNVLVGDAVLDPFLNGQIHTWASFIGTNIAGSGGFFGNAIGNGIEAAVTAPLAVSVARAVGMAAGTTIGGARPGQLVPDSGIPAVAGFGAVAAGPAVAGGFGTALRSSSSSASDGSSGRGGPRGSGGSAGPSSGSEPDHGGERR
ncbi:hypothetical protein [Conexibacter sp. S30A1]|uniref:hypothetical protein n=1 Tax=Conexibacter sp. S30A1 TaxID=2937800 RepID=UPI00200D1710|nr:hypothetical protein [Conexibacter sp. S30A1]